MAADHMSPAVQVAESTGGQKCRTAHASGGHEKVAAPSSLFKHVGCEARALAAVIKGQGQRRRSHVRPEVQHPRWIRNGVAGDGIEMAREGLRIELVER